MTVDLRSALQAFNKERKFGRKGPLCVALVITQHARKMGLPLDPQELGLTKELVACLEQRVGALGQAKAGDAAAAPALAELEAIHRSAGNVDGLARTMARQALALGSAGRRAEALARAAEAQQMALAANLPDLAARIAQAEEQIRAGR